MGSLKDELKKAFKEKGIELTAPDKPVSSNKNSNQRVHHKQHVNPKDAFRLSGKSKQSISPDNATKVTNPIATAQPLVHKEPVKSPEPPKPKWKIDLEPDAKLALKDREIDLSTLLIKNHHNGVSQSLCSAENAESLEELTLGFDFGTSSSKMVIGDPQQQKAFAVPFFNMQGIDQFLMPARVTLNATYSLLGNGRQFRDLKLSLRHSPDLSTVFACVGFMALAIRHARGWLFDNHESLYKKSHLLWNMVVGIPSDQNDGNEMSESIKRIASAAWLVAGIDAPIDDALIESCLDKTLGEDDAEVTVCSEIAAQMYGFVSSESFDPHGRNTFLLVDVGAGTLDASLFYVARADGDKWRFVTYCSSVEFNGAVNLHRNRLDWLLGAINESYPNREDLVNAIHDASQHTDCLTIIPSLLDNYLSGMEIKFEDEKDSPDSMFRNSRVGRQIFGVYQGGWQKAGVPKEQLKDLPTFYCGGGMRVPFYANLPNLFDTKIQGYSWIHPVPRQLVVPDKLVATGLLSADFDRLSVAYGLSLMRKGEHVSVAPVAPVDIIESQPYSNYILFPK